MNMVLLVHDEDGWEVPVVLRRTSVDVMIWSSGHKEYEAYQEQIQRKKQEDLESSRGYKRSQRKQKREVSNAHNLRTTETTHGQYGSEPTVTYVPNRSDRRKAIRKQKSA